ncbi:MAG: GNAT family N-acetyltransferase [Alphaproteobacteria bacterium]|nr:GNAT family N-acetyltransferase [Alphaproteobacteria bacterium]
MSADKTIPHKTLLFPPLLLQGPRVNIRPPCSDDKHHWLSVRAENRAYLEPFEPRWETDCLTEQYFSRRIGFQSADWWADRHYALYIEEAKTAALIGGINLNYIARGSAQFCSLGYWIAESRQGQGLMQESLSLVLDWANRGLKLRRINAATLLDNGRSQRLLERLGFQHEGMAPKYLEINGEWQDHLLFGKVF